MRGRIPALVLSVALLAGCGSNGEESTTTPANPEANASAASAPAAVVARTFLKAGIQGRGGVACSLMTPESVSTLAKYVQSTTNGGGSLAAACAEYFTAFQTSGGGTHGSYKVGQVTVNGSKARATVLCPVCDHGPFSPRPLQLRKTAAGWRVKFDYRQGY